MSVEIEVRAEGGNALCPYCLKSWLYTACWWDDCRQWTCGQYDCRLVHNEANHKQAALPAELRRSRR